MDILRTNFLKKLDFILSSIRSADFVALDTEFSGLCIDSDDQIHAYD